MATRWTYSGDVDPQNGGMFIRVCPEHGNDRLAMVLLRAVMSREDADVAYQEGKK